MTMDARVIVAGYGQMGHAMEAMLAGRAQLDVWPIAPGSLDPPAAVLAAAGWADFLLLCVPTVAHEAVLGPLAGRLAPATAVLSVAKGLDDAGRTAADILQARLGARPWGVLGGPMIANEIIAGRRGFAELGTADAGLFARVRQLYPAERLRLTHTAHPQAVSWCGVLKNIYAPLVGVADGLGWGDNVRGHLIMAATAEMQRLLTALAGAGTDAHGDAGLADFATTVTSASSHHYTLGLKLARGGDYSLECEGVHSLRILQAARRVDTTAFTLYGVAAELVRDPMAVPGALHEWLHDRNRAQ